jgi:Domain of unknown function (DUF4350)
MSRKTANRRWWFGGILLATLILLTVLVAPGGRNTVGSTFGRGPDGYGAWYAFMEKQGVSIARWQKPAKELFTVAQNQKPMTVLQIYNQPVPESAYSAIAEKWLQQGNTLIMLGVKAPVTPAAFSSRQDSPQGAVKIDTSRRYRNQQNRNPPESGTGSGTIPNIDAIANDPKVEVLLGDQFGGVVWQRSIGKGTLIAATTPFLAANAYQDEPGNYAFLAQLVKQAGGPIKVDEYLHGYKDAQAVAKEVAASWEDYLAKTPLLPIAVQTLIILLLVIWAKNRRLGPPLTIAPPTLDNSTAYIQALASVLQKAGSSEFILETVGKAEQLQIQRELGLGAVPLSAEELINGWIATGRSADDLQQAIRTQARKRRLSDAELATWLQTLQTVRQQTQRS